MRSKKVYQQKEVRPKEENHVIEPVNYFARLPEELAVTGVNDTAAALNEDRVHRLIICANLSPSAGWQCYDCQALYGGRNPRPEQCFYCGSVRFHMADLKAEMISRAYQRGCSIEVMSRCPELERAGGIGALLHKRY